MSFVDFEVQFQNRNDEEDGFMKFSFCTKFMLKKMKCGGDDSR
jgi:hypothetical protein